MNDRKKPQADLKKYYTVFLQLGMVITLLLFIIAVKIDFTNTAPAVFTIEDQEIFQLEDIPQTEQIDIPAPPPKTPVPQEVPNDEFIEDEININAELTLALPLNIPSPPENDEVEPEENFFEFVEKMPEIIGGQDALNSQIVYPERDLRAGISGMVIIRFIVDQQGNVLEPEVIRSLSSNCDAEALRAIQTVKFTPGIQQGRPVRVRMTQPIYFQIDS